MLNNNKEKYSLKSILGILFILLFALASPLFAHSDSTASHLKDRHHDPEKMKELIKKLYDIKHQKLRDSLRLDDETAKQFFMIYEPAEKDLISLVKERQKQEVKLLQLTRGEYADADVDPTMQSIKSLNLKIQDRYEKLDNDVKSILKPRQRAKLLLFEKEFNRKFREKMNAGREAWEKKHPGEALPTLKASEDCPK
jgi:Spy/CpxP family protein refolding chaperone